MQSILLISENREKAKKYIGKLSNNEKVDLIDINVHSFEKAIGIEDIRNIRKNIFLMPLKSKRKIVVIEAYEGITIESQNALLKILEEPPNNTIVIIAVGQIGPILPTILSRCKIVDLKQNIQPLSKQELSSIEDILVYLQSKEIGGKLKMAQDLTKNKDDVIPWIEKMIMVARNVLLSSFWGASATPESDLSRIELRDSGRASLARMTDKKIVSQYLNILVSLQKTHTILKTTNVSPRLTLENLFLNL